LAVEADATFVLGGADVGIDEVEYLWE